MNGQEGKLSGLAGIVTGATRGIGRAVTAALARRRMDLALVARGREGLAQTRELVESLGARAIEIPCDLADAEATAGVVDKAVAKFGRLDTLVNNAALSYCGPFVETPTDVFDRLLAVNARGPFILCREAIGHLRESPCGTVINILSVASHRGYPLQSAYAASKHALLGITKVLAAELHESGVRVHAITPGGVATELVRETRPDLDVDVLMSPEDIAEAVIYLLTHRTNAMIDELRLRRAVSEPSF